MLDALDDQDFLAFIPRGGPGITLPLAQHLSTLGHAIDTIASRGRPEQMARTSHVARARLEAHGQAINAEASTLNDHVMEHFSFADPRRIGLGWRL